MYICIYICVCAVCVYMYMHIEFQIGKVLSAAAHLEWRERKREASAH